MTERTPPELDPKRSEAIESLFASLPTELNERNEALQSIRKSFYAELAEAFQPTLNEWARAQPQLAKEDKSELATAINTMARHLGLAVACPRTNQPATIVIDTSRRGERIYVRYRFHTATPKGNRIPTSTFSELPDLELCQAPTRIESLSKGFRDTGRDDGLRR